MGSVNHVEMELWKTFFYNAGLSEDFENNKSFDASETFDELNLMFWNPSQDGPLPEVTDVEHKVDCSGWENAVFQVEKHKKLEIFLERTRALRL